MGVQLLAAECDEDLVLVAWTDAVGNRRDLTSTGTGGHLVGVAHKSILEGKRVPVNPVAWRSGKLHRVAKAEFVGCEGRWCPGLVIDAKSVCAMCL